MSSTASTLCPKVLVVDDTASMREGISAILRHIGCQVETAVNGEEGYQKARQHSPDLILSDLEMPVANGFDLLTSVRSDPALALVPFIMITGVSERSSTRRAMELGADDYLTKPFTPDEVIATVQSRLDKQRNWRQATEALASAYSHGMMNILPHEMRTPLNAILGFAQLMSMMADQGLTPEQTHEFADTIQRAGKTLLSHTTRFLTLMEFQGLQSLPSETFELTEISVGRKTDSLLKEVLPNHRLTTELSLVGARIACREHLFWTIFRELLGNAIKFARSEHPIRITGTPGESSYRIDIENHGHAFPTQRARPGEMFVQFDRERHEQQGLGIGLAIVNHAARLAHVQLQFSNEPGGVVRARIELPLAR